MMKEDNLTMVVRLQMTVYRVPVCIDFYNIMIVYVSLSMCIVHLPAINEIVLNVICVVICVTGDRFE